MATSSANRVSATDILTQTSAANAILSLDAAIDQINSTRSTIGAIQNRVQLTVQTLNTAAENLSASESRIRDADFAFETARFTRNQILVQAGTAILAQANNTSQVALQLLGGR
ncbi:MAG: flagellin [bacterium]|nr:MAG: flagellin [bacterium]